MLITTTIYGMAAPLGLEPRITDPESVVLPITLRGNTNSDYADKRAEEIKLSKHLL